MTIPKREDRRVERTRHFIRQAFVEIIREKGFASMSVQDIAARANVNRGTFYIHFTDKYMLLDAVVRGNFQELISNTLPPDSRWERGSVLLLIRTVLKCFEDKYRHQHPSPRLPASLLEQTIYDELNKFLLTYITKEGYKQTQRTMSNEQVSQIISWSILGPAVQWSQKPVRVSFEQMADTIFTVIMDGAASYLTDGNH